jgi:hypothetical protein
MGCLPLYCHCTASIWMLAAKTPSNENLTHVRRRPPTPFRRSLVVRLPREMDPKKRSKQQNILLASILTCYSRPFTVSSHSFIFLWCCLIIAERPPLSFRQIHLGAFLFQEHLAECRVRHLSQSNLSIMKLYAAE